MHEADLHLDPNEASDLCRVLTPEVCARHGWDRATADGARRGQRRGLPGAARPRRRLPARRRLGGAARACGSGQRRRQDRGRRGVRGPERPRLRTGLAVRQEGGAAVGAPLLDRARKRNLTRAPCSTAAARRSRSRGCGSGSIAPSTTRLAAAPVELLALGPLARKAYIEATIQAGEKGGKRWAGRVQPGDQPINVEAAEFRADGRLLLGLRYPVTADGHPLLVEIHDVESLFADPDALPRPACLVAGERRQRCGAGRLPRPGHARRRSVRRDRRRPRRRQQVRDRARGSPGGRARRVRARPLRAARTTTAGPSTAEVVHHFGDIRRVEGVAIDHEGHSHYVIDEEGHVALRTLIFE